MKLTAKQQIRIDVISKYLCGEIYYVDACAALEIKERQFRRLVKAFREKGVQSVLHGNVGKVPTHSQKRSREIKKYFLSGILR